ncbi:MAG: hypothetical protein IPG28_07155 [Betaproteobacteria bacterium]|nr:hypothetical protein [Betaproteobacteria bacterium]MBK7592566.1 hypothetical protein [Betaproteobacteria bacterium]MBK8688201.1 hypothetical protein [Betaproteobacteria bacterium]MBK9676904.1 hypothetical protein [Betaproteobacteria bacterium]
MKSLSRAAALVAAALVPVFAHGQTQPTKPPISTYGVDVATRTMSIPGMPAGGMGAMGALMPGGMGGGPQKELWLGLRSTQKASGTPGADHLIPPGMNMGASLPLLAPPPSPRGETYDEEKTPEKPKARMLIYWGCGDAIRPGQPKIADTEKMSLQQFGQALAGRSPPERWSAIRNMQYVWPNERERSAVPADASLRGEQLVRGTATPDIRFPIGERQDFMPPLQLDAKGPLAGPTVLSWAAVAAAQGYFLQAMGFRQDGNEMILWSSSELQDTGWGLMNYLPNDFVRRMIGEKVVLPPTATTCTIPKGVFEGVDGGMVNGIAYGEELNLAHPPRPTNPKVAWEPIWAVKVRVKSVGMVPLGMEAEERGSGRRGAERASPSQSQQSPAQPPSPLDDAAGAVNKLKDLLKF